jgi:hypothetical protein
MALRNGSYVQMRGLSAETIQYLHEQSVLRCVSTTRMLQRIIRVVGEDRLVHALLDDAKEIEALTARQRKRYERKRPTLLTTIGLDDESTIEKTKVSDFSDCA